jgi:hypothetical protein
VPAVAANATGARASNHDIHLPAAAFGADQPLAPIGHGRFGAVPLGHLGRVGLDLMAAILTPDDQPDAGGGSVAERHRRAALGFHFGSAASGPAMW